MYDAMNKGIKLASGKIIGFINSDDLYTTSDIISTIVNEITTKKVDSAFADLVYVKRNNPQKIVRYYRSVNFSPDKLAYGMMPAHPTFFARRNIYEKYGLFKTDYQIAADYELLTRFLGKYRISFSYIPKVILKMRMGGLSTRNLKSNWILNKEIMRACMENGIETNFFRIYSKYLYKIAQFFVRPSSNIYAI
jgi:glycosyltransferase involved in cell wall biosynthesis